MVGTPPQTRLAETGARCASFIAALQRSEAEAAQQRDALLALQQGAARLRAEAGRASAARDVAEKRLKEETEGTKRRAMEAVRAAEAGRSRLLVCEKAPVLALLPVLLWQVGCLSTPIELLGFWWSLLPSGRAAWCRRQGCRLDRNDTRGACDVRRVLT